MSRVAPLISIVIGCSDQGRYAYETLLSAKRAYGGPLEIIVVEHGGATPRTSRQIEEAATSERDERCQIEIVSQKDGGVWAAHINVMARATGEFVQVLDCGDLLLPGKLDDQILHFQVVDALDISLTGCLFANATLDLFERRPPVADDAKRETDEFGASWDSSLSLPIARALFRRSALAASALDEKLPPSEADRLWPLLATAGARIAFMGGPGAVRRLHEAALGASSRGSDRPSPMAAKARDFRPATTTGEAPRPSSASRPRVSIVIPVYEHFDFLERCLASAAVQGDGDVEIVVVDDASRDARVRPLLQRFAAETGVKLILQPDNLGVAETLNAAVAHASGEYIAFLDCDDALEAEAARKALAYLDENPECDYLFTDRYDISENDEILRLARYGGYRDDRFTGEFRRDLINGMVASHLKVIRRAAILRAGGFEAASSGVQDWVMALEIAEFGRFGYLPEPLYNYRVHPGTVTRSDMRGQILRANVVRRRFAARYFRQRDVDCRFRDGAKADLTPMILSPAEICVRDLGEHWSRRRIVIDTSAGVTDIEIWRLREFSGYFDKILWSAPEIYAALLGYVWSPDILQRA